MSLKCSLEEEEEGEGSGNLSSVPFIDNGIGVGVSCRPRRKISIPFRFHLLFLRVEQMKGA